MWGCLQRRCECVVGVNRGNTLGFHYAIYPSSFYFNLERAHRRVRKWTVLQNYLGNFSISTEREFFRELKQEPRDGRHDRVINGLGGGTNSPLVNLLMKLDGEVSGHTWGEEIPGRNEIYWQRSNPV